MLSLTNLTVADGKRTVIDKLRAEFSEGFIYGIYAKDTRQLKPLLECMAGQTGRYTIEGDILYNGGPVGDNASLTDCCLQPAPEDAMAAGVAGSSYAMTPAHLPHTHYPEPDLSKDILLLHDLCPPSREGEQSFPDGFLLQQAASQGKIIIVTSQHYKTLRQSCDYIYLFDEKRFPIIVEKADLPLLDDFFENVFRQ